MRRGDKAIVGAFGVVWVIGVLLSIAFWIAVVVIAWKLVGKL